MHDSNVLSTEYSRIFISRNVPHDKKNTRVGNCFPAPFRSLQVFSSRYFSLSLLVFFINFSFFHLLQTKGVMENSRGKLIKWRYSRSEINVGITLWNVNSTGYNQIWLDYKHSFQLTYGEKCAFKGKCL